MSSTQVINDVNKTLYKILRESVDEDVRITFGPPTDEDGTGDNKPKLFVFLYNITEDPFSRGRPREYRGGKPIRSLKAPLGVNLYYMLTPFSSSVTGTTSEPPQDPVQAHTIIAQIMRAFYDNGIIDSKYFPANNTIGELQMHISPAQMNFEEITKIWSSFNKPFRLSVCYEVSIIYIQSQEKPKEIHLVDNINFEVVPAIGKKNLSMLKARGWNVVAIPSDGKTEIADIQPAAVRPGMALSIHGTNFQGRRLTFKIEGREIDENSIRIINDNLVKVEIPADEKPGIKKLTLKLEAQPAEEGEGGEGEEEQEPVVATLEVLSSEPSRITITDIRPDPVRPGDLITVHGINFTEEGLEVSIGDTAATKTFVDNSQINVMIPGNASAGTTRLTIKSDQGTVSKQFRVRRPNI